MDKPFSMVYNETRDTIVSTLNKSNLHPCILLNMLTPIYLEVQTLANETANDEKNKYVNVQEPTS